MQTERLLEYCYAMKLTKHARKNAASSRELHSVYTDSLRTCRQSCRLHPVVRMKRWTYWMRLSSWTFFCPRDLCWKTTSSLNAKRAQSQVPPPRDNRTHATSSPDADDALPPPTLHRLPWGVPGRWTMITQVRFISVKAECPPRSCHVTR